ncbi:MAG: glycosyltransferase family 4 protein [Pseudomonadota bacterium]
MRILILSHYFRPEINAPASRTYEHCKRWVALGHDVTVVSCVPHHPMGKVYPGYKNRLYQSEEMDGIKVVRLLTYVTANEGVIKRTWNYVLYMLMAILAAPFLPKCDIVLSTSPQFFNGLAGYFVSKMKGVRWVLEIRDLWPDSILAVGAIKNPIIIRWLEGLERFVYRKADHIVSVTHSFGSHILARGGREDHLSVVTNGVDLSLFQPSQEPLTALGGDSLDDKFVVSYVGTIGMAHGLETILNTAKTLRDQEDIVFLLVGDGADRGRLEKLCQEEALDNVRFLGQVGKDDIPKLLQTSNASLVILRKLELFKSVIPSKIFEAMAMGTPIILGVEGEAQEIVEKAGAGLCIEPESEGDLREAILQLKAHPDLCTQIGKSGKAYVAEHYDRQVLAGRFEAILKETAGR